jgi:hypothetical protein
VLEDQFFAIVSAYVGLKRNFYRIPFFRIRRRVPLCGPVHCPYFRHSYCRGRWSFTFGIQELTFVVGPERYQMKVPRSSSCSHQALCLHQGERHPFLKYPKKVRKVFAGPSLDNDIPQFGIEIRLGPCCSESPVAASSHIASSARQQIVQTFQQLCMSSSTSAGCASHSCNESLH